ncbi:hypothetical protein RHMOL_Rhmol13G0242100 [Rhododendron molle]|uniref:Uncharacterized protein n=1 Tax=Rhododendron molle TaxID=49168 RepID=A0ACC0LAP0_RHOML|nr:hypothetical protein RHMOL_Rhmol13G0242100 [Rhododendron molle]
MECLSLWIFNIGFLADFGCAPCVRICRVFSFQCFCFLVVWAALGLLFILVLGCFWFLRFLADFGF